MRCAGWAGQVEWASHKKAKGTMGPEGAEGVEYGRSFHNGIQKDEVVTRAH